MTEPEPETGRRALDGTATPALERLATGVAGFDEVLNGGLVRGGVVLIGGQPGTGKTTLGNHLAYNVAAIGGVAIVATVLAETHARILVHLEGFDFFDPTQVAQRVHYVSLYDELTASGLDGVVDLLRRLVRERQARLLVIDGAGVFEEFAPSPVAFRRFTAELNAQISALGCTAVLLIDHDHEELQTIGFHVDGILVLEDKSVGLRDMRLLHVVKLRGVNHLRGRHHFAITSGGFEVYPRLEATPRAAIPPSVDPRDRQAFEVPGFDEMLHGGLVAGSTTLLEGSPGAGKTIAGLHFIVAGARRGERGLIVRFHEAPAWLIAKATGVGLELGRHVETGGVHIVWHPPLEQSVDAWARELLEAVAKHRPRRLFVDGLADVQRLVVFSERWPALLSALTNALREQGVTSIFATETSTVVGAALNVPVPAVSATIDNTIVLRYVELRSRLRRLVSIVKIRDSDFDPAIREFLIGERGIEVSDMFESTEAILTGVARQVPGGSAAGRGRELHGVPEGVGQPRPLQDTGSS